MDAFPGLIQDEAAVAAASSFAKSRLGLALTKLGLSIFLIFHLTVITLVPNAENRIGIKSLPFLEPYIEFFEFSGRWSFFAPEPGQPVYLDWEIENSHGETVKTGMFPEKENPYFLRDRQNRRILAVAFMIPEESRVEKIMLPYLCGKYPDADSVSLWRVADAPVSMEDVATGRRAIGDEVHQDRRLISRSFCGGGAK